MLSWTTAILFLVGWVTAQYLIPFALSFYFLNHDEDVSVITGEPLQHHHTMHPHMPGIA